MRPRRTRGTTCAKHTQKGLEAEILPLGGSYLFDAMNTRTIPIFTEPLYPNKGEGEKFPLRRGVASSSTGNMAEAEQLLAIKGGAEILLYGKERLPKNI